MTNQNELCRVSLSGKHWKYLDRYTRDSFPDRPKLEPRYLGDTYRFLKNEIHEWMIEFNIEYCLSYETLHVCGRWFIEIPNDSEAVLFKLTWM